MKRECTDRDCGNNPKRRINPRDYDSVMGFLCGPCEDAAAEPECPLCGLPKGDHEDAPFPCTDGRGPIVKLRVTMSPGYCMETDEPLEADSWETTAEAFIAENALEDGDAAEILALEAGQMVTYGGGAAPYFEVVRAPEEAS